MVTLIDRETEMKLIDEALRALQNHDEYFLRTPVLDFFGVEGIGKTALLRKVQQQCKDQKMYCIWVDASQNSEQFSKEIIRQVEQIDGSSTGAHHKNKDLFQQSIDATKTLLGRGAVVMLLDAVDTSNEELVKRIGATLSHIIEDNKLFVILTSRKEVLFDTERSVARKLTTFQLKPFNRKDCEDYLKSLYPQSLYPHLGTEIQNQIFEWTHGYPLAMQVMTNAIVHKGLDPRKTEDQKELLALIVDRVITKGILARVQKPPERDQYMLALTLLSVPRRFNLIIMQDLIEEFEPELKRESTLAYMSLPRSIDQATNVLSWNLIKAGFSVATPVRNILLLKCKIEQPERYLAIHSFLARLNKTLAAEVPSGSDRIRYLREYLYHSVHAENSRDFPHLLEQTIQQIANEPLPFFQEFYEEFLQDKELKEALGEYTHIVLSLIYRRLAQIHRQLAQESSGTDHFYHLREFFYYLINDPEVTDIFPILTQAVHEVIAEEPLDRYPYFTEEMLHNDKFRESLGKHFGLLASLIREYLSSEG